MKRSRSNIGQRIEAINDLLGDAETIEEAVASKDAGALMRSLKKILEAAKLKVVKAQHITKGRRHSVGPGVQSDQFFMAVDVEADSKITAANKVFEIIKTKVGSGWKVDSRPQLGSHQFSFGEWERKFYINPSAAGRAGTVDVWGSITTVFRKPYPGEYV